MLSKPALLAVLAALFSLPITAQEPSKAAAAPNVPALADPASVQTQTDVQYGVAGGQKLLLDAYFVPSQPGAKPRPAVVLLHGGSWSGGDKEAMSRMAQFLARSGYIAIAVNYRLLNGNQNQWPAQLDDAQRSVRWLRANAAKYNIDPDRIGAFGHSAGAQLAALLGMEDTRDNSDPALRQYSSRVQAVVDVDGPIDFVPSGAHPDDNMIAVFGGSYEKMPDVWRAASPAYQVKKSDAPFLIVHGTADDIVPIAQAQELYDKLQQAGVPVQFNKIEDGHTFTKPESKRRLAFESLLFFNQYLGEPAGQGK